MMNQETSVVINVKLTLDHKIKSPHVEVKTQVYAHEEAPELAILLSNFSDNLVGENSIKSSFKKAVVNTLLNKITH
ncbi:hypothetical protein [Proteus columbae]|uniref:hypothetical protein n=1 Tax=Proteus columbae TaxID=1987580 RepID=UPI0034D54213